MAESKAPTGSTRASSAPLPHGPPLRFERFELDEANARLMRDGKAVTLAPTPFAVLCALVRTPGALLTKHALLDQVWGHQFVSESVLKTVISELRTVLDDDARRPRFIETVSRRGYRFIAPTFEAAPQTWAGVPRIGSLPASAFIGRGHSLSRLRSAWDLARSGKRSITWIAGDPGIGKTTLIEHFVAGLGDVACIRGQCVEQYGGGEPYLPVLEALAELCRRDRDAVPLLRAVAPTWLLQLPWLTTAEERDVLRRELAGVRADRALREMGELLDRYTERRPLLLVTEDLHWSDRSTVQLIDYVARRRGSARLMWLASFRLAEVVALDHPLNALRRELRLHRLCEEIVLDPFSEREVAEYVAQSALSIAADEAFVRALHERTDGLPLFVASVTSEITARGAQSARQDAAAQIAKIAVPENLAAIIDHYIANLGEEQRMVLSAAAVCGVEFRAGTIAGTLERDAAWVSVICEELLREQLWLAAVHGDEGARAQELRYSFRHALFREVLYERTVAATRTRLHRKAGAALEQERATGVPVTAGELAVHFERGGDPTSALRYYAEAAEAALLRFSPAECMSLTERGLMLLDKAPQEERKAAEIALATLRGVAATQLLGVGSEAKSALERAYSLLREVPEHPMRTRLLYAFGFFVCLRGEYAEALAVAERAEAFSSATSDPILMLAAGLVHSDVDQLQGRWQSARAWAERGLALAQSREPTPGEMFVADPQVTLLGLLAVPLLQLGLIEQGRACLERAHARARELGQPMARLVATWFDALFEVRLGNAERVAALADEMRALVEDFALGVGRNGYRWFRGWADARMGQPLEGYRAIRESYDDNTRLGMLSGGSEVLGYAAEALVLNGDWEAAQEQLQEALQVADSLAERVYLPQLHLIGAAIAHGRGDAAAASASLRRALAEARAQDSPWLELLALVDLCEHGEATGTDRRALAALVDRLTQAVGTGPFAKAQALLDTTKRA